MKKSCSILMTLGVVCLALIAVSCSKPQKKAKPVTAQPPVVQPAVIEHFTFEFTGFKYKSWNVSAIKGQLVEVADELPAKIKSLPADARITVYGHADKSGPESAYKDKPGNRTISERRAQAVVDYLVKTFGLSESMFTVIGKGSQDLKLPAKPYDKANRRVEIVSP